MFIIERVTKLGYYPGSPVVSRRFVESAGQPACEKGMKESYIEDLASHGGPDHALATREGAAKRWTGVHAGQPLSLEIAKAGVPTRSQTTEGNNAGGAFASRQRTPRGRRTCACVRSLHAENREIPRSPVLVDDAPPYTARGVAYRRVAGRAGNAKAVIP
jgi:hypothetical protein